MGHIPSLSILNHMSMPHHYRIVAMDDVSLLMHINEPAGLMVSMPKLDEDHHVYTQDALSEMMYRLDW